MPFFPIGDNNPHRNIEFPFVNWTFIILCGLAFVAALAMNMMNYGMTPAQEGGTLSIPFLSSLAFYPAELFVSGGGYFGGVPPALALLTNVFIHGSILILGINLVMLWIMGDNVEDSMGHGRYALFLIVVALAGSLIRGGVAPDSTDPVMGAGPVVLAVVTAYAMFRPMAKIRLLFVFDMVVHDVPALLFGIVYMAVMIGWGWSRDVFPWADFAAIGLALALVPFFRSEGVELFDMSPPPEETAELNMAEKVGVGLISLACFIGFIWFLVALFTR